jgi:DNA-binding transcriptional regulator/RsmH inhibitor MraZ
MIKFCGQDNCLIDANGRIKLTPRFLADFREIGAEVVVHCLPEGALGVYSPAIWQQMRQAEPRPAARAVGSIVFRRQLRRFGALSQLERITNQGRITIPVPFREILSLGPGTEAVLVGTEIGVEVWNAEVWQKEFAVLAEHELKKAAAEMDADLEMGRAKAPPDVS